MKGRVSSICLVFLIVSLVFSPAIFVFVPSVKAQESNPSTVASVGVPVNWTQFWQLFKTYALWNLEWYDGSNWISVKEDLDVIRNYPEPNWCKITLNFTASHRGNYRLTFAVEKVVREYVNKTEKFCYELTYDDFMVTFDWSDCANISGLIFSHGLKEVAGEQYFWFRIRRDNVPLGAHVEIDPSTVATSTNVYAVSYTFQRKGFYAAGRYWAFYHDGTNAVYESTTDPTDWSGTATSIGACTYGYLFAIWFDGTYVHYARYTSYCIYYRRGTPNSDGTITWSAVEQTVHSGTSTNCYFSPSITVDSSGYAWIASRHYNGANYTPKVLKNANNDGTWSDATGFPYQLSTTDNSGWQVQLIALTSLKVYVIYCYANMLPRGRLYDGGWGSEESDLSDYNIQIGYTFRAVAEGDHVHFAYNRRVTYQFRYNKRTYGTGWGVNDVLVVDTMEATSAPSLSIDTATNNLYLFYARVDTDHVYYIKCVGGTWDASPTDWIDESTDTIYYGYLHNAWAQAYNGKIGLLYVTKSGTPFNIKFDYLTTVAYEEYSRSASQSITLSLTASKLFEITRPVTQTISIGLTATRLFDITRLASLTVTFNFATSRIADFFRSVTQTFTVGFTTSKIAEFFRSVSQTITTVLSGQRLAEWFKSASQAITFTLQGIGESIVSYFRNVALTITMTINAQRLAEWYKSASQAIMIIFNAERLIDITKAVSQTISFIIDSTRIPEFVRAVTQSIGFSLSGARLIEVTRQAVQTLNFIFNGERLLDITRTIHLTIKFVLEGFGSIVTEFERVASLTLTFTTGIMGIFGESTSLIFALAALGIILALVALALVATKKG